MKFGVTFWDGKKEYAMTKKEAVKIVKNGLNDWMQRGDTILWIHQHPDNLLLCAAFVINELGETTDASALIEEESKTEGNTKC